MTDDKYFLSYIKNVNKMTLIIGENISLFNRFHISREEVIAAYTNPDRMQSGINKARFYIKKVHNARSRMRLLLVATKVEFKKEHFLYSFWLPEELCEEKQNPIEMLALFANLFGLKVNVGDKEGYFLQQAETLIIGNVKKLLDIIRINAPDHYPYQCFSFIQEKIIHKLNHVILAYSFAINIAKYVFWLEETPLISIRIPHRFHSFVKENIVDLLQPDGQTQVRSYVRKIKEDNIKDERGLMTDIEVPKIYSEQIKYIVKLLEGLKPTESYFYTMSFSKKGCVFCGSPNSSKEHIIPKWIRPHIEDNLGETLRMMKTADGEDNDFVNQLYSDGKRRQLFGTTTQRVCRVCNNGWLSKLEESVKSTLISNNQLVKSISDNISNEQAFVLSKWVIIKSLLLSLESFKPHNELMFRAFPLLKENIIPEGFLVETISTSNSGVQYFSENSNGCVHRIRNKLITKENALRMIDSFFCFTIQINSLLFRVSYIDKNVPFERQKVFKRTFVLYPESFDVQFEEVSELSKSWQLALHNNMEVFTFHLSLVLREKQ